MKENEAFPLPDLPDMTHLADGKYLSAMLVLFMKHTPAAVAMFDTQMRYLMHSEQWVIDHGLTDQSLIGRNHYEVLPDTPDRWRESHQRCLKGVSESCIEDPFQTKNGQTAYINWTVTPWFAQGHEVAGLIMFTEVVTDRVHARQDLELAMEAQQETQARLESFVRALSENLHEPLQNAAFMAEHLQAKLPEAQLAPLQDQSQYILTQLQRAQKLLDNLTVYLGDIPAETAHTDVSMLSVLSRVVVDLDTFIQAGQVNLLYSYLPIIKGNELELRALLKHLLSNAIYYAEGKLEIRVEVKRTEAQWQFAVCDNGPGLPPEEQAQLFDQFRSTDRDGSGPRGISLPLCRRIVERMGGQIWVESEVGVGTCVYFTLPVRKGD